MKIRADTYFAEYTIDFENKTYVVAAPGEFYETENIVRESANKYLLLPSTVFKPNDRDYIKEYYIFDLIDATGTLYLSTNTDR